MCPCACLLCVIACAFVCARACTRVCICVSFAEIVLRVYTQVFIERVSTTLLVNGSVTNVTFGLKQAQYPNAPLDSIRAPVLINPHPDSLIEVQVYMEGIDMHGISAPAQRYNVSGACVVPMEKDFSPQKLTFSPTERMLPEMAANQFLELESPCVVAYHGADFNVTMRLIVSTGSDDDFFSAFTPQLAANVSTGPQQDILIWYDACDICDLQAFMGQGADTAHIGLPCLDDVNLSLGVDVQVDAVRVFTGAETTPDVSFSSAEQADVTLHPTEPDSSPLLHVTELMRMRDLLQISNGYTPTRPVTKAIVSPAPANSKRQSFSNVV